MNDETSYKKEAMQDLAAQIARLRNQYNDITGNLESNVTNLRNYWVEDTDALAVLEELPDEPLLTFKTCPILKLSLVKLFKLLSSATVSPY